ncbi:MAG: TrkA family potassium uptake protein [Methanosphaera sp.]|nr:TrkA family potassium uptake protein [Methanosphaera sp.]
MINVIIVGAGKVGTRLVNLLMKYQDYNLTLIDNKNNKEALDLSEEYEDNITTIKGDATNKQTLEKAGIATADIIVIATSVDEVNLLVGIMAQNYNLKKVIARTSNPQHIKMFKKLGLNEVVSPEITTFQDILKLIIEPNIVKMPGTDDNYELTDITVKSSKYIGKEIGGISPTKDYIILMCKKDNKYLIAQNNIVLKENDTITILTKSNKVQKIKKMFGKNSILPI